IDLTAADPLPEFKKLLALARYANVWAKVSELSVISPSGRSPYRDTHAWVRRLYDAFGPDRLLWGTGFPGAARAEAGRPSRRKNWTWPARRSPSSRRRTARRFSGATRQNFGNSNRVE